MLRYERKYLVPNSAMNQLRNRLLPFVNADQNTIATPGGHSAICRKKHLF